MGGEPFDYQVHKDGSVRVFWEGRCVTIAKGGRGRALAAALAGADVDGTQALLQRVTGNFERGNERRSRRP